MSETRKCRCCGVVRDIGKFKSRYRPGRIMGWCEQCRDRDSRRKHESGPSKIPWTLPRCPYESGEIRPVPYGGMHI